MVHSRSIPILMYHLLAPEAPAGFERYTVTPAAFAAQMKWLARTGHQAITPEDLLLYRKGERPMPRRPVLITLDDGFQSSFDHALPVLEATGLRATFYLVAGLLGAPSRWLQVERRVELPLVSWQCARAAARAGFQIGAHTLSHPRLTEIPAEACRQELGGARRLLEDKLGCEVRHLAYPFGCYSAAVREMAVQAGFLTACSTIVGLSGPGDDLLALQRVRVSGADSMFDFICRVRMAFTPAELLRRRIAGARRRMRAEGAASCRTAQV